MLQQYIQAEKWLHHSIPFQEPGMNLSNSQSVPKSLLVHTLNPWVSCWSMC